MGSVRSKSTHIHAVHDYLLSNTGNTQLPYTLTQIVFTVNTTLDLIPIFGFSYVVIYYVYHNGKTVCLRLRT